MIKSFIFSLIASDIPLITAYASAPNTVQQGTYSHLQDISLALSFLITNPIEAFPFIKEPSKLSLNFPLPVFSQLIPNFFLFLIGLVVPAFRGV